MNRIFTLSLTLIVVLNSYAQNVGVGNTNPHTKLEVTGAISSTPTSAPAAASVVIPNNVSIFYLTAVAGVQANVLIVTTPQEGQYLTIYDEDSDAATFSGQTITGLTGVKTFEYINAGWRLVSDNQAGGNNDIQNQTAAVQTAGFNVNGNGFIGNQMVVGDSVLDAGPDNTCGIDIRDPTGGSRSDIEQRVATTGGWPSHIFALSRGTLTAPSAVQNDVVGTIEGWSYNGSAWATGSRIVFGIDGVPVGAETPGFISFATSKHGSNNASIASMILNNQGNLGIGNLVDSNRLCVQPGAAASKAHASSYAVGIYSYNSSPDITIGGDTTSTYIQSWQGKPLSINATANKVGIGTASPGYPLDIRDTFTVPYSSEVMLSAAIGDPNFQLVSRKGSNINGVGQITNEIGTIYAGTGANSMIRFYRGVIGTDGWMSFSTNADQERVRIDKNGNVGIGTTNPTNPLQVAGNTETTNLQMTAGAVAGAYLQSDASGNGTWVVPTAANSQNIYTADGTLTGNRTVTMGADNLTFTGTGTMNTSGNVGIGTTNSSATYPATANRLYVYAPQQTTNLSAAALKLEQYYVDMGGSNLFGPSMMFNTNTNTANSTWNCGAISGVIGTPGVTANYPGGLAFSTKGADGTTTGLPAERMRITSAGNVGIGTTSPAYPLEVNGNGKFDGSYVYVGSGGGGYYGDAVNLVTQIPTGGYFYMANTGIDGTRVAQADGTMRVGGPSETASNLLVYGNTAMGGLTPLTRLDVTGNTFIRGNNTNTPATPISALELFAGRNNGGGLTSSQTSADISFQYGGPGGGYRHFIQTRHNSSLTAGGNDIDFYLNNSGTAGGSSAPGTGNTAVMSLESNNGQPRVGIGNTAPASTLHIGNSTSSVNTYLTLDAAAAEQSALQFNSAGAQSWVIYRPGSSSDLRFYSGGDRVTFQNSGNVGIGTNAPAYTLDIAGTSHVSGNAYLSSSVDVGLSLGIGTFPGVPLDIANGTTASTASVTATNFRGYNYTNSGYHYFAIDGNNDNSYSGSSASFTTSIRAQYAILTSEMMVTSDARIKHIEGRSDAAKDLATLCGIRVTDYQMRDQLHYGDKRFKKVIAQELEQVYPLAVNSNHLPTVIPDIYAKPAKYTIDKKELTTTLAEAPDTNVKVGSRCRYYVEDTSGKEKQMMGWVNKIEGNTLHITSDSLMDESKIASIFLYGVEINDLLSVDYDAISMLNVSATQELNKKVEALEKENAAQRTAMQSDIDKLKASVEALEDRMGAKAEK